MDQPIPTTNGNDESLVWIVRLSRNEPAKRWVIFLAAGTAGVAGAVLLGKPLVGVLAFAIILAATAEFWLGVRYKLGPTGASATVGLSRTVIEWPNVKRVVFGEEAIRLSPLDEESRLDSFRGVVLRTLPENREKVRNLIETYCGGHVRFLGF